jgi:hypothetical protein
LFARVVSVVTAGGFPTAALALANVPNNASGMANSFVILENPFIGLLIDILISKNSATVAGIMTEATILIELD